MRARASAAASFATLACFAAAAVSSSKPRTAASIFASACPTASLARRSPSSTSATAAWTRFWKSTFRAFTTSSEALAVLTCSSAASRAWLSSAACSCTRFSTSLVTSSSHSSSMRRPASPAASSAALRWMFLESDPCSSCSGASSLETAARRVDWERCFLGEEDAWPPPWVLRCLRLPSSFSCTSALRRALMTKGSSWADIVGPAPGWWW
mmetsp:Transcript_30499/g.90417  ORF Transcript_30499/g.90417 Transcript_30499/m.90417 type:complete len:210 (-) Transcript_30499:96-725(-)